MIRGLLFRTIHKIFQRVLCFLKVSPVDLRQTSDRPPTQETLHAIAMIFSLLSSKAWIFEDTSFFIEHLRWMLLNTGECYLRTNFCHNLKYYWISWVLIFYNAKLNDVFAQWLLAMEKQKNFQNLNYFPII